MKKLIFYKCQICGNVIIKLVDSRVPVFCCGQKMEEIKANSYDGAKEKHKPVISIEGNKVSARVGEIPHPMTAEHYISHIILQTDKGFYVKELSPLASPTTEFLLTNDEKAISAYSICNLHGIWESEIE